MLGRLRKVLHREVSEKAVGEIGRFHRVPDLSRGVELVGRGTPAAGPQAETDNNGENLGDFEIHQSGFSGRVYQHSLGPLRQAGIAAKLDKSLDCL